MSDPNADLAPIGEEPSIESNPPVRQDDPFLSRLRELLATHQQLSEREKQRQIEGINWAAVFEGIGPDEGVDLGAELPELPGQADQPWPAYSWFDDGSPGYFNGSPQVVEDNVKRRNEVAEKVNRQSTNEEEGED